MIWKPLLVRLLSVLLVLFFGKFAFSQNTATDSLLRVVKEGADWRVYSPTKASNSAISLDSLSSISFATLRADSVKMFLHDISIISKEREPVWMGMWVGSYLSSKGERRKVLISEYGGFFLDTKSGIYFSISKDERKNWMNYIDQCLANLFRTGEK
jgi:hypothetical protein